MASSTRRRPTVAGRLAMSRLGHVGGGAGRGDARSRARDAPLHACFEADDADGGNGSGAAVPLRTSIGAAVLSAAGFFAPILLSRTIHVTGRRRRAAVERAHVTTANLAPGAPAAPGEAPLDRAVAADSRATRRPAVYLSDWLRGGPDGLGAGLARAPTTTRDSSSPSSSSAFGTSSQLGEQMCINSPTRSRTSFRRRSAEEGRALTRVEPARTA